MDPSSTSHEHTLPLIAARENKGKPQYAQGPEDGDGTPPSTQFPLPHTFSRTPAQTPHPSIPSPRQTLPPTGRGDASSHPIPPPASTPHTPAPPPPTRAEVPPGIPIEWEGVPLGGGGRPLAREGGREGRERGLRGEGSGRGSGKTCAGGDDEHTLPLEPARANKGKLRSDPRLKDLESTTGGTHPPQRRLPLPPLGGPLRGTSNQQTAVRLEQIRQAVRQLAGKKAPPAAPDPPPPANERSEPTAQVASGTAQPAPQPVLIVRGSGRRRSPKAFWERRHLGRLSLQPLR